MLKKSIITLYLLLIAVIPLASATTNISGTVKDKNNKPFPAVYVSVKGYSMLKTTTSLDGSFNIQLYDSVKFPVVLEFYSVGFKNKILKIPYSNRNNKVNIKLEKIINKDISREKDTLSNSKQRTEITITSNITNKKETDSKKKSKDAMLEKLETRHIYDTKSAKEFSNREVLTESTSEISIENIDDMSSYYYVPPPSETNTPIEAGKLTAGELNDFSKWELWQDITKDNLAIYQQQWRINPYNRYVVQLMTPNGLPIINAQTCLKDNTGNTIWETKTDNTGKAELWAKMLDDSVYNAGEPYTISFTYMNKNGKINAKPFAKGVNTITIETNTPYPTMFNYKVEENSSISKYYVDIDFIVDATGSMADEIDYLQAELYDVIAKVENLNPNIKLRTASTFYRDYDDEYIIKSIPFDTNYNNIIEFIKLQSAGGGGDTPEAVDDVLIESIENREWMQTSLTRIAFIILDAPPHQNITNIEKIQRAIRVAAMKGIRIVPLVCSGADKPTEYLMRSIALATNGTYVFLTDESGIGGNHLSPTTDKYEVEKLNDILLRIINEFCKLPKENETIELDFAIDKFVPKPYNENPIDGSKRMQTSEIMQISPNPCYDGILNIKIYKNIEELYLADITGKVLQNLTELQQDVIQMDISGYANGVFFINAFYEGRWYTEKIVLNR